MSGLGWKLRRLGAMGPAEIAHRAQIALRDRVAPLPYVRLSPTEAAARLFSAPPMLDPARAGALARVDRWAAGYEPVLDDAHALMEGRFHLFGREVQLDDPPRWNRNYASGAEWPDLRTAQMDYRVTDAAHAPKYVWELGRLTTLPILAAAARIDGTPAAGERALHWLEDFTAKNPLGHGIQHATGIEMAVRTLTTLWALALLEPDPRMAPALGLVAQQALHCRDHLSLGSSGNNHLIAEYAAMAVAGALLPGLRGADALARRGHAGLEAETLRQFHPDGVNAEQAFGYLPFIWELLLAGFVACEARGLATSEPVRERLRDSLQFARTIRLPGGGFPHVGDEDDGRVLLASEGWSRLDLVGNALAAWLRTSGLAEEPQALARMLCSRAAATPRALGDGTWEFPQGGWTVWRSGRLLATFDHGPLGLGPIAAHGHADALSITICDGATPLIVDPGTGVYHEQPELRDRFRGTPWHSTVSFGGRSQSEMLGPFLWGRRAEVTRAADGWSCRWASGEFHVRRVAIGARRLFVVDRVHGTGATLHFALAPGAAVTLDGARAHLRIANSRARIETEGILPWQLEPMEYSDRFGSHVPSQRLVAPLAGNECKTTIQIE